MMRPKNLLVNFQPSCCVEPRDNLVAGPVQLVLVVQVKRLEGANTHATEVG